MAGCALNPLTRRQHEVLLLVAVEGLTYKQVAFRLGLTADCVRSHAHNAYQRLGVVNAQQAAVKFIRNGWDDEDGDIRALTERERAYLARMDAGGWRNRPGLERVLADVCSLRS